jgi:hypothetical protein
MGEIERKILLAESGLKFACTVETLNSLAGLDAKTSHGVIFHVKLLERSAGRV